MKRAITTIPIVAVLLVSGCARGRTDELTSAGTIIAARPVAGPVSVESNRTPEPGWWTWPPPRPDATPSPVNDSYDLSGDVLFARDQAELAVSAGSQLDAIVRVAHMQPNATIVVTGYTDSDGTPEHNLTLSEQRAQAVAVFLSSQGVSPDRLQVRGVGEADPVASNDSESHKAANRRVVVTVSAP